MTVSILGSGNIAHFFAKRFYAKKVNVHQIYSPNKSHAMILAKAVEAQAINEIKKLDTKVDAIIIAITDQATLGLVSKLNVGNILCVYTSGSIATTSLQSISKNIVCIWPIHSIIKSKLPAQQLAINAGVVCTKGNSKPVSEICNKLNIQAHPMSNMQKEVLHLSATVLNNFTNHLMALTEISLAKHKLSLQLLHPLLHQMLDTESKAVNKQTGPAIRKDKHTINKHLLLLNNNPQLKKLYKILTNSIQQLHS